MSDPDFDRFFREQYGPMVRSLTLVAGDRGLAADAVQDAFVRAYARWGRVRRYAVPAAWVRRVALNRVRDLQRSEQRRRRREERAAGDRSDPSVHRDDAETHGLPGDHELAAVLARLPERQRVAAALHYVDGLKISEIGDVMRISDGAVKFHLHEARKRLAALLEPAPEDVDV